MAGNAYHAVCSCFALSSKLGSRLYCSVLRRDSTVLVSLTPCCTLSPACVTAAPAFGRLSAVHSRWVLVFIVYSCAMQQVCCGCVTTVVQYVPPCGSFFCVCFLSISALLSKIYIKKVCSQPAPGGERVGRSWRACGIVWAEAVQEGLSGIVLQMHSSAVRSAAVKSACRAMCGGRQLVGCSTYMAVIQLVQQYS
jgi:hypothetical protein